MKKILKNIKNLLFRHKILSLICLLALIIIIILIYMFCSIFVGGNDAYGNRLDGIEDVEISDSELDDKASSLEEKDEVEEATVRIQGKIIYFDITFSSSTSLSKAKEIASDTLEDFTKEELEFYDFEYVLVQTSADDEDDDESSFTVTGTKTPQNDSISWIKS